MKIEVQRGDRRTAAGLTWENETKRGEMKASLQVLEGLVAEGLFAVREERSWRLEMRYDCAADWAEFLERPVAGPFEADMDAIDAALSAPGGRVFTTEEDLAVAYDVVG
jgi:hypothetical protein